MPQFLPTLDIIPGHMNKTGKVYNTNAKTKLFAEEVNAIGGRLVTGLYTVAGRNLYVGLPPAEFEAISEFGAALLSSIGAAPGALTLPITLPVDMSGFPLSGLPLVPTDPTEAASKAYVDGGGALGPFVELRAALIAPAQVGSWKLDGTGRMITGTDRADHTSSGFAGTDGTATFGLTVSGLLLDSGVGSIGDLSSLRLLMTAGAATADVSTTAAVFNDGAANVGTYGPVLLDLVSSSGAETTISTGASAAYIVGVSGFISALDAELAQWRLTNSSGATATIKPRNIIMADPAGTQFARLSNVDLVFDSGFGATSSISFGASFLSATGVSGFNVAMDSELAKLYLASPAASTVLGIGASALLAMGSTGRTSAIDAETAELTLTNALAFARYTSASVVMDNGGGTTGNYLPNSIRYNSIQVLGTQEAAIADSTDISDAAVQLNLLLAACRAHGLIAT